MTKKNWEFFCGFQTYWKEGKAIVLKKNESTFCILIDKSMSMKMITGAIFLTVWESI